MKFGHGLGHQGADWADLLPKTQNHLWLHSGKVGLRGGAEKAQNSKTLAGMGLRGTEDNGNGGWPWLWPWLWPWPWRWPWPWPWPWPCPWPWRPTQIGQYVFLPDQQARPQRPVWDDFGMILG